MPCLFFIWPPPLLTPAPDRLPGLAPLGLLGRLTRRPCSLEHFHNTPAGPTLVECLRKHLNLCHLLSLETPLPILIRYHLAAATDPERTSEDKEFAMSTQDVVAIWEQRVRREEQDKSAVATRRALLTIYELRFGPPPEAVRASVTSASDPELLTRWTELFGSAPKEQVDRELSGT